MALLFGGFKGICPALHECSDGAFVLRAFADGVFILAVSPFAVLYFPYQLALLVMGYKGRKYYLLTPTIGVLVWLGIMFVLIDRAAVDWSLTDWVGLLAAVPLAFMFLIPNLLILRLKPFPMSLSRN
ncbi:MAG: hypothetical protein V2I43_03610 [Parvularcula sp.]|jgi:hypothetical protein|nr:hypothetical protein [Parvularcula sp.]